eukprot:1848046-Rhodomonas_salina.1
MKSVQSRLLFVPHRPFDNVAADEIEGWLENLKGVFRDENKIWAENGTKLSNKVKPALDGTGPMKGLDLSQIAMMWGSLWEGAEDASKMDKAVAKRFMDRHSSKGTVENMEQRAHLAWRLACMEMADEQTIDWVFAEGSATLKEDIPQ